MMSLVFSIYKIMLSANRNTRTSSFLIWMALVSASCLISLRLPVLCYCVTSVVLKTIIKGHHIMCDLDQDRNFWREELWAETNAWMWVSQRESVFLPEADDGERGLMEIEPHVQRPFGDRKPGYAWNFVIHVHFSFAPFISPVVYYPLLALALCSQGSNVLTCLFHQLFYREEAWGVEMGNDCSESLSSLARGRTGIGILRLFWRHRLFFYQLHAATIAVNPSNPWFQPWIICLWFPVILRNHLILLSLVKLASRD